MKLVNLSEQEVARHFRRSTYWQLIGRPKLKTLVCQEDYQPNGNIEEKIFVKNKIYIAWVCDVKNIRTGSFWHGVAIPAAADNEHNHRYLVPVSVFGKQNDEVKKQEVDIPNHGKYLLTKAFDGHFYLVPDWHFRKDKVAEFIRQADKKSEVEVKEYNFFPRIIGVGKNKLFMAYEVNRRISDKVVLRSFFNVFNGKEVQVHPDTMISLVGNVKMTVIAGVTAKYISRFQKISMNFH